MFVLDTVSVVAKTAGAGASFNTTLVYLLVCLVWSGFLLVWINEQQECKQCLDKIEQNMEQSMQFYFYEKLTPVKVNNSTDRSTDDGSWSSDDEDEFSNG